MEIAVACSTLISIIILVMFIVEVNDSRRERELLLNRIQIPDPAAWQSLGSSIFDKDKPPADVDLSSAPSEAEDGEMFLVGKVMSGDFQKDKKD